MGAGALSGFMGTIVSIGGPPIALLYQNESGPSLRGTLSAFFVVGVALAIIGLCAVRTFRRTEALLSALRARNVPVAAEVGEITDDPSGRIEVPP